MDEFVAFAQKWKELVGAFIGGVFSLLVALLVASQARRAEERTAATLLIGEFLRVHSMVDSAKRTSEQHLSPEQTSQLLAERICQYRVRLSPLFESSIARVLHVDVYLAGTMTLAASFIRDTEPIIERLSEDVAALQRGAGPVRNEDMIHADIKTISSGYELISLHAKHSARLLQEIVLASFPRWRKFRFRYFPNDDDKDLLGLLKRGEA
jgi:hypothetical protein